LLWSTTAAGTIGFHLRGSMSIDFSNATDVSVDGAYEFHSFVDLNGSTIRIDIFGTLYATHGVLSGTDLLWTGSTDSRVDETGTISATGLLCTLLAPACTRDGVPFTLASLTQASGASPAPQPQPFGAWSFTTDFSQLLSTAQIVLATFNVGNPLGGPPGSPQEYLLLQGLAVPEPRVLALLLILVSGLAARELRRRALNVAQQHHLTSEPDF